MNDILTLDDLSRLLAVKHNISKEDADRLLESFLKIIEKGLKTDRYVRIKGLGTFKLIEDDADGNGASSNKIIFVPDVALKETVNKPFSHFEPVVLNENVCFDDIEEHMLPDSQEQEVEAEVEVETKTDSGIQKEDVLPEEVSDDRIPTPTGHDEDPTTATETLPRTEFTSGKSKANIPWCLVMLVLIIGLLLGGIISWLIFSGRNTPVQTYIKKNVMEPATVMDAVPAVTVTADSAMITDSVVTANNVIVEKAEIDSILKSADEVKNVPEMEVQEEHRFLSEKLTYRITGTIEQHTIEKGNTLAKIAYKYYKNKKMWPYIVMHNKNIIKDPNNVPIGTVINIPRLEAME